VKAAPARSVIRSARGAKLAKGYRTRNNKRTDSMIVQPAVIGK